MTPSNQTVTAQPVNVASSPRTTRSSGSPSSARVPGTHCIDLESSHGSILHPPGRVVNFHTVCALVVATVLDVYSPTAATHGKLMNAHSRGRASTHRQSRGHIG